MGGVSRASVAHRLFRSVRLEGDCWISELSDRGVGYACIKIGGRVVDAHRVAYDLVNGPIPPRMLVLHNCDVRRCVAPAHLRLGTHKDNVADMIRRGRDLRPERRSGIMRATRDAGGLGNQKLDRATVETIRQAVRSGSTRADVAKAFGVSRTLVGNIVLGRRWSDERRTA
jgi:hypothetical protein